ncbi:alpha/beta hydrolase [Reichenbachiella carrageenanivorans]|uniref:Alpha/beta hydrolase n=1 Tax=Reichenbachiella carrageenanivorans TaxID=2979869 RepID=A0ABY6D1W1_9BACT|nr:alpha/beta hydrolase [Reichenbachiella carrageenanivorans]UXX79605.1 alpha/beta hydrolase [Reichenbachiella carrageenanivorans]
MRSAFLLLFTLSQCAYTLAQTKERYYLDATDHTANYYEVFYESNTTIEQVLVLIPGFGETPERVILQTDLPLLTVKNGILTIIPVLADGVLSLGVDEQSQKSLQRIIEHATLKYNIKSTPLSIGGFSIGGSAAIKYAEQATQQATTPQPIKVFAIDPPLDFERFYQSAKRRIRLSKDGEANKEDLYITQRIEVAFGGPPETALTNYHRISPYSYSDTSQSNIKPLIHTALRIYTEPDVHWWISERGNDYSGMNALDASCIINELNRLGNSQATLITTQNKGFRKPDNRKHPHAWSIVDNEALITWLKN